MIEAWRRSAAQDLRHAFRGSWRERAIWITSLAAIGTLMFSIAIAQAAVLLAGLFWGYHQLRGGSCTARRSPLLYPYALFVLARIAAIPFSIDPSISVDALRTEIFFYVFFFVLLCALDARREDQLRVILYLLVLAGLLATVAGFIRMGLGMDARLTSTTAGYYTLGGFLAIIYAMSFSLGRRKDIFPSRVIWLVICAILLVGLLFTFNRLHWVVAAVATLVIGLRRERRIVLVLTALALLLLITVEPLQHRFLQLLNAGSNLSGRDVIWRGAFMLIGEHPVTGFGLRTFHEIFPLFDQLIDKGVGSWHNDYLQVYMDSGLMALVPFLAVFGTATWMGWRNWKAWPQGSLQHDLNTAAIIGLLGFAIGGGTLDSLLSILFRTLLALIAVLYAAKPLLSATER
ncbi:hypothetical protein KQI65_17135 [bacterium]|nr:hypothetical protein [bacterium]